MHITAQHSAFGRAATTSLNRDSGALSSHMHPPHNPPSFPLSCLNPRATTYSPDTSLDLLGQGAQIRNSSCALPLDRGPSTGGAFPHLRRTAAAVCPLECPTSLLLSNTCQCQTPGPCHGHPTMPSCESPDPILQSFTFTPPHPALHPGRPSHLPDSLRETKFWSLQTIYTRFPPTLTPSKL